MNKQAKVRLHGAILLTLFMVGVTSIILLLIGAVPESIVKKDVAEITAAIIGLPSLLCISFPWDFFIKEEKNLHLPAPIGHPVWDKRKLDKRYGTIQPPENYLRVA